jgi:protein-S-isoprenylcysteine O-methyltransferase Ste14
MPMQGIVLVFFAVLGWGALHSLLAGRMAKAVVMRWYGPLGGKLYRITYNTVAGITLIPLLAVLAGNIGPVLARIPWPWWPVMGFGQVAALALLFFSFLQSDPAGFLGLRQLGSAQTASPLFTAGTYSIVRHPMYTAGLLILWLFPILTAGTLAFDLGITLYILVGSELEERKLIEEYGDEYRRYKAKVPRLIPFIF